jgi:hypothetical protein
MKFNELHGLLTITEKHTNDLNTIKSKLLLRLNAMKARTNMVSGVIHFKTINIVSLSGYVETNYLIFRIYKEGTIAVDKNTHELSFAWSVKLDTLLVLAFCSSAMLGICLYFPMILGFGGTILSCSGFFLLFVFSGTQFIKYKMTALIESCVYRDSH